LAWTRQRWPQRAVGISKGGDRYLRTLLIHGAALRYAWLNVAKGSAQRFDRPAQAPARSERGLRKANCDIADGNDCTKLPPPAPISVVDRNFAVDPGKQSAVALDFAIDRRKLVRR
jgi:hypothetical protein